MQQTYLFIGASSAIATATARILTQQGHRVLGFSTKDGIDASMEYTKVSGYSAEELPNLEGAINGLVYFPGSINLKPFHRFSQDEIAELFQRNVFGAIAASQKYYSNLKASGKGSVVFISSVAARTGMPFHGLIGPAKAALEGLTVSLAAEWTPTIRVNAVSPSLVNSPLAEKFLSSPEKVEAMQKRNPMQKVGEPEELAQSIAFLLSDQSAWITGQVLAVDGGMGTLKL